jgi:hypothetical protein
MSDRRRNTFQRALDEAASNDPTPNDAGSTRGARMRAVAFGAAPVSGGKARFGLALDWAEDPADPPSSQNDPRQPVEASNDTPIEIAAELGLGAALTLDQLTFRWRDFVWRNHPDRQSADARDRANARVAIANTLYDRARQEIIKARTPPAS